MGSYDEYSDSYMREVIFNTYSLNESKLPRFIILPYSSDGSIRLKSFAFLIIASSLIFTNYTVISYCGLRMHWCMKRELKKFSAPNRRIQRQFFKALIFQSLGPTFFIFTPAVPVFWIPLLPPSIGIRISWQTGWLFSMIGAYPPFDSIAFMLIVSEYRDLIKNRFLCGFGRQRQESAECVLEKFNGKLRRQATII